MGKHKLIEVRPKKRKHPQVQKTDNEEAKPHKTNSTTADTVLSKHTLDRTQFHDTDKIRLNKRRLHQRGDTHPFTDLISMFSSVPNNQRWRRIMVFSLIAIFISILVALVLHRLAIWRRVRLVTTPIQLPKIISEEPSDSELFWGTYRPGLYFGMRQRRANSPLVGLIWGTQNVKQPQYRHLCDSNDGILSYNWLEHDGRTFGTQQIVDKDHILTVSFIKRPSDAFGGDWTVRVSAASKARTNLPLRPLSVIVYFYYPDSNSTGEQHLFALSREGNSSIRVKGNSPAVGPYEVHMNSVADHLQMSYLVTHMTSEKHVMESLFSGLAIHPDRPDLIALTGVPMKQLQQQRRKPDTQSPPENTVFFETTVLPSELPSSAAGSQDVDIAGRSVLEVEYVVGDGYKRKSGAALVGVGFTSELDRRSRLFHQKFAERFVRPEQSVFSERQINLTKIALSNLLGGMGYFSGSSLIRSSETGPEPVSAWESVLFTATPSRPMFPRGFLWDEGFHGLVLARWDPELAMQTVGHWLDLMNGEGWIPREQILGDEARSRVPDAFVVQSNTVANPPTLVLVIEALMDSLPKYSASQVERFHKWSILTLPRLHAWYQWFNSTQAGQLATTYRWRGRDPKETGQLNPLTLSSGLDDYPRASHPSECERHLDLRAWMAVFARVTGRLASLSAHHLQTSSPAADGGKKRRSVALEQTRSLALLYASWADQLTDPDRLDALHWSEATGRYADYGLHTDSVRLQAPDPSLPNPPKPTRVVGHTQPSRQMVTGQFGYVNLFPLFLRLLPAGSPRLLSLLIDLSDRNLLWTDYGLRSLAPSSPLYQRHNTGDDPPYWRGAIWINMNYLAVRSLRHYASATGASKEVNELAARLAESLADNLARTVLGELERTGNLWEQYEDVRGRGQRVHPFAGWTALISLVVAEAPRPPSKRTPQ